MNILIQNNFLGKELYQQHYSRIIGIHLIIFTTLWFHIYCFRNYCYLIDIYSTMRTTLFEKDGLLKEHWIFKLGKNNFEQLSS